MKSKSYYAAIADDIAANNDADYSAAFDRMKGQTVVKQLKEARYSELMLLSTLGVSVADPILSKIESAVSPRISRLIQSENGIDLADPQTEGLLNSLVSSSVITQAEMDSLLALTSVEEPKWPGLRRGECQNALEWRASGVI